MSELVDTPKRFIAGAKCPACQAVDRLVLFRREGKQFRECVSCGYLEPMQFETRFAELETRVNRTPAEKGAAVAVVRLVEHESPPKTE